MTLTLKPLFVRVGFFQTAADGGGGASLVSTAADDALTMGGATGNGGWQAYNPAATWNGSAWGSVATLPQTQGLTMYGGNGTTGIGGGGFTGTAIGTGQTSMYTWNGTVWTTVNSMNIARSVGYALGGTDADAFAAKGQQGSGKTQNFDSETYDGSAWSLTGATSTHGGQGTGGGGTSSSFFACGGTSSNLVPETWNGTAWTVISGNDFPQNAYAYGQSCATDKDDCMYGNYSDSTGINQAYKWNGSSWSDSGSVVHSTGHTGFGGNTSSCIACGHINKPSYTASNLSQLYNGSSWAATGTLPHSVFMNGVGAESV